MSKRAIFRKVALDRLSSPEQLDQLMQVTDPKGWLALGALGLLLAAAVAWGVYGSIPTEAVGEGILLRRGGVADLVATGDGQVEEMLVAVGDVVAKGQAVAALRQEELSRQIQDAEEKRAAVREEYADLASSARQQRQLRSQNIAQQRANLERSIATLVREVEILDERVEAERVLLADGLITKQTLLTTEQERNDAEDRLAALRLELDGLALSRLEAEQQLERQLEVRRAALRDLDLEVRELEARLAENVEILSPYDGRVLELAVDRGDVVSPGSPMLSLEILSEELLAVLFVPAAAGKRVRPGMEARVSPSNVRREEFGYMLGEVSWVAEFPSTSRGMLRLLANQDLVDKLMEEGPTVQVDVTLIRDAETPSGFRWSSSTGPDLEITSGTLADARIILREDRPVSLLLPTVREKLGI